MGQPIGAQGLFFWGGYGCTGCALHKRAWPQGKLGLKLSSCPVCLALYPGARLCLLGGRETFFRLDKDTIQAISC